MMIKTVKMISIVKVMGKPANACSQGISTEHNHCNYFCTTNPNILVIERSFIDAII